MNILFRLTVAVLGGALFASVLAGCGGPPRDNPMLQDARQAYQRTAEDAQVREHAPVALEEAREALERAEAVRLERASDELVNHHAYVARQRTEIARQRARMNASRAEFQRLEREREQLRIDARTAEAEAAEARARAERRRAEQAQAEAQAAAERAAELSDRVAELQAEMTARGLVMTMGDVLFDVGRATLQPDANRSADVLAQFLREFPERRVLIEGHTDSTGSRDLNMRLSSERAAAVRQALISRGVSPDRIATVGLGPDYPVASNTTAAGRQQNRRVEIIISDIEGNIPAR